VQLVIRDQNTFLRPTPVPVRAFLSRNRPIGLAATMAGDLPRHDRLMPTKNHSNQSRRLMKPARPKSDRRSR